MLFFQSLFFSSRFVWQTGEPIIFKGLSEFLYVLEFSSVLILVFNLELSYHELQYHEVQYHEVQYHEVRHL